MTRPIYPSPLAAEHHRVFVLEAVMLVTVALMGYDAISTWIALSHIDGAAEANPAMAWAFETLGLSTALVAKILLGSWVTYRACRRAITGRGFSRDLLWRKRTPTHVRRSATRTLWAICALMTFTAIWNTTMIWIHQ